MFADGPLSVHISGPGSAPEGTMVTLLCSASSRPDCDFYWYINSQASVLSTGPAVTFPASKPSEGNYTCVARNPVTGVTLHLTAPFLVGEGAALCCLSSLQHRNIKMVAFPFRTRRCAAGCVLRKRVAERGGPQPHDILPRMRAVSLKALLLYIEHFLCA